MIIELFGPPAVGKTTLAHALATELEKNGFDIQLIMSSRPAERGSIQIESTRALSWWRTALAAPLSRTAKLVSAGPVLLAGARSDELTASLMAFCHLAPSCGQFAIADFFLCYLAPG